MCIFWKVRKIMFGKTSPPYSATSTSISIILMSFFSTMMPLYLWHSGQQSKLKCNERSLSMNIHCLFECYWAFSSIGTWAVSAKQSSSGFSTCMLYSDSSEARRKTSNPPKAVGPALQIRSQLSWWLENFHLNFSPLSAVTKYRYFYTNLFQILMPAFSLFVSIF